MRECERDSTKSFDKDSVKYISSQNNAKYFILPQPTIERSVANANVECFSPNESMYF